MKTAAGSVDTAPVYTSSTEAADVAHGTVDRASEGVHEAVDDVAEKISDAQTATSAKNDDFKDADDWKQFARDEINVRPLTTVGLALAIGWLIGRL